jgi:hypothetical protein
MDPPERGDRLTATPEAPMALRKKNTRTERANEILMR